MKQNTIVHTYSYHYKTKPLWINFIIINGDISSCSIPYCVIKSNISHGILFIPKTCIINYTDIIIIINNLVSIKRDRMAMQQVLTIKIIVMNKEQHRHTAVIKGSSRVEEPVAEVPVVVSSYFCSPVDLVAKDYYSVTNWKGNCDDLDDAVQCVLHSGFSVSPLSSSLIFILTTPAFLLSVCSVSNASSRSLWWGFSCFSATINFQVAKNLYFVHNANSISSLGKL